MATNRQLDFTTDEYRRVREAARALNTSLVEFIHEATMQAVSEVEAGDNEAQLQRRLAASPFTMTEATRRRVCRTTCERDCPGDWCDGEDGPRA